MKTDGSFVALDYTRVISGTECIPAIPGSDTSCGGGDVRAVYDMTTIKEMADTELTPATARRLRPDTRADLRTSLARSAVLSGAGRDCR